MNTPAPLAKIAECLGWMKAERHGVEVWYDPEGGYVVSAQLLEQMGQSVPRAIEEMNEEWKATHKLAALRDAMEEIHARASAVINNGHPDEAPDALAGICKRACDALRETNK